MVGIYGNHPEDQARARELDSYLAKQERAEKYVTENLDQRADDKFFAMADFYASYDGVKRYTNIEDYSDSITRDTWRNIARALRDGNTEIAGNFLMEALKDICRKRAEEELEQEFEDGKV